MSQILQNADFCPHCGETDIRYYITEPGKSGSNSYYNAFCHDCGAEVKYGDSIDDILIKWNTRVNNGKI